MHRPRPRRHLYPVKGALLLVEAVAIVEDEQDLSRRSRPRKGEPLVAAVVVAAAAIWNTLRVGVIEKRVLCLRGEEYPGLMTQVEWMNRGNMVMGSK